MFRVPIVNTLFPAFNTRFSSTTNVTVLKPPSAHNEPPAASSIAFVITIPGFASLKFRNSKVTVSNFQLPSAFTPTFTLLETLTRILEAPVRLKFMPNVGSV